MDMGTVGLAHIPSQRWAECGELSFLLHGGRGRESWSTLCILPKNEMQRTKLPKWMSLSKMDGRRTKLSQIHFVERVDGGGTISTPFWREQGARSPARHSGRFPGPSGGEGQSRVAYNLGMPP